MLHGERCTVERQFFFLESRILIFFYIKNLQDLD